MSARRPIALLGAMLLAGPAPGAGFGPWSADPRHPTIERAPAPRPTAPRPATTRPGGSSPFGLAFRLWSEALTRIDGPRCSHRPSCSAFARQALARYRLPIGLWMTMARLMRGARSSALRALPIAAGPGGALLLDPLADYAFWRAGYSAWSGRKK